MGAGRWLTTWLSTWCSMKLSNEPAVRRAQLEAAIALTRDGEMECRATTGADAPDLGVRLETASGLSGACLRTGEVQHCLDTETDDRVDAAACRQLGVRSMLVMPLDDGKGPFGILEVLSAKPKAFGARDIDVLRSLGRRIVASKREAEMATSAAPDLEKETPSASEEHDQPRDPEMRLGSPAGAFGEPETRSGNDAWSVVLVVLVIAVAVALGVVIGWRGAAKRWMTESRIRPSASPVSTVSQIENAAPVPTAETTLEQSVELPKKVSAPPLPNFDRSSAGQASGDLVVTQNGKVIYRLQPRTPGAGSSAPAKSTTSQSSPNRLIHQVEPDYPAEAKTHHIQGPVLLDVQVLSDGSVGSIGIIAGNPLLTEAAVHAVRQWKYQPYLVDGRPVESQTRIKINFTLPPAN